MRFWKAIASAAALALPLQASAQDAVWPAGPDDCAVIAEVGKAQFHWSNTKSDTPLGNGSFGTDCDFKGMGLAGVAIAPPDPGPYYKGLRLAFQRPVYTANGQHAAITFGIGGSAGPKSYFATGSTCEVEKRDGAWRFLSCKMRWIT